MAKVFAIGVDLGGTNTRAALVRTAGSVAVAAKRQMATRRIKGPRGFIAFVKEAARSMVREAGLSMGALAGIGVGLPGSVDTRRGRAHFMPNIRSWRAFDLARPMRRETGLAVRVDNDANAMAWGEFLFGAARGMKNAVFLTLGTGVGGGLILDGRLFHGSRFSAAEIGHIRYRPGGRRCACGARGCIETELGNSYLLEKLKAGSKNLSLEAVTRAARDGRPFAVRFWKEAGEILGDFLAGLCNLLNPEAVVIGGGVSQAGKFLLGPARDAVKRTAFPAARGVRIVPAKFGPEAGLIGAAALVVAGPEGRR